MIGTILWISNKKKAMSEKITNTILKVTRTHVGALGNGIQQITRNASTTSFVEAFL